MSEQRAVPGAPSVRVVRGAPTISRLPRSWPGSPRRPRPVTCPTTSRPWTSGPTARACCADGRRRDREELRRPRRAAQRRLLALEPALVTTPGPSPRVRRLPERAVLVEPAPSADAVEADPTALPPVAPVAVWRRWAWAVAFVPTVALLVYQRAGAARGWLVPEALVVVATLGLLLTALLALVRYQDDRAAARLARGRDALLAAPVRATGTLTVPAPTPTARRPVRTTCADARHDGLRAWRRRGRCASSCPRARRAPPGRPGRRLARGRRRGRGRGAARPLPPRVGRRPARRAAQGRPGSGRRADQDGPDQPDVRTERPPRAE